MKTMSIVFAVLAGLIVMAPLVADESPLETDQQKYSYALGHQIGRQIAQQINAEGVVLDADAFSRGIADVLAGRGLALSEEEMMAAISAKEQQEHQRMSEAAGLNAEAGDRFRAEYSARAGVSQTQSGLLYRIITEGAAQRPGPDATVVVHYRGTLPDGTEFDSSHKRGQPATFSLAGIIPGWREALQLMGEGALWEVVIPAELAYGKTGAGGLIGPNQTLLFEIELLEIK